MMRLEVLRTRVARRILLLFVLGALAPVLLLGVYAFSAVTEQLRDQSRDRLQQLSKSAGMSIMERLKHAEADLDMVAAGSPLRVLSQQGTRLDSASASLRGVDSMAVTPMGGRPDTLSPAPVFRPAELSHLARGGALLRQRRASTGATALWLVKQLDSSAPRGDLIWVRIEPDYLWADARDYVDLPSIGGFCVLVGVRPLYCAGYDDKVRADMVDQYRVAPASGRGIFQFSSEGEEHIGAYWELFLRSNYQTESWSILVGEPSRAIFQPLRKFAIAFPPVLLFGLVVVTLFANGLVRRTMDPLEKLAGGAARIATQDFGARVEVDSKDEFGDLARGFNDMAERLGVQFRQLEASRAIDQAVLSSTRPEDVVDALLTGFGQVLAYDRLAVLVLGNERKVATLHWSDASTERGELALRPTRADLDYLASGDVLVARAGDQPSPLLGFTDARPVLVLPFRIKSQLRGAVMVGRRGEFTPEEVLRARQIVDQAALALNQGQLVTQLEEMNWGTLRALARAIDAKSKWTGGHAERVAGLAVSIGEQMGLSAAELETLRRGGLLHDIGKIGIPAAVLDSHTSLSTEERTVMEGHVIIGARILEPVAAYADVIPIVLYHHERWDGSGYPRGLAGSEIPLLARVLAVADAYDAMVSVRPYRTALTSNKVLDHLQTHAGRQFDPEIVAAFARVLLATAETAEAPVVAAHGDSRVE